MAHSKANLYSHDLYLKSIWCRVRSYPGRLKIIYFLLAQGPSPYYEINQHLTEISGTTVSNHIRYLVNHNIIVIQEKFPKAIYEVNHNYCEELRQLLMADEALYSS